MNTHCLVHYLTSKAVLLYQYRSLSPDFAFFERAALRAVVRHCSEVRHLWPQGLQELELASSEPGEFGITLYSFIREFHEMRVSLRHSLGAELRGSGCDWWLM